MTSKRAFLVVGLLLAIAGLLLFFSGSGGDTSQKDASDKQPADNRDSRTSPHREVKNAKNSEWVGGIVVERETETPISGARIAINRRKLDNGLTSSSGNAPAPLVVVSDNSGRFRVDGLSAGQYSVSVAKEGYLPHVVDSLVVGESETGQNLRFALTLGGHRLYGTVTDIGGGVVPFAFVRAKNFSNLSVSTFFRAPFTAMTNAQGEYELTLGDGRYQVDVFHDDYRSERQRLAIGGQDLQADFVLTPGSGIDGQVLRVSDDSPVEGAMVSFTKLGKTRGFTLSGVSIHGTAVTDAQGRFSLRGLGNGSVELRAVSPHAANAEPMVVDLAIAETASNVIVYVDEAYTVSGHVVSSADEESKESGVIVGAYNLSPGALFASNSPSLADGYFEIHGVHPGHYTVGAAGEERLPNFFGTSVEVIDNDIENLIVTVDHGNTISGQVSPPQETSLALQIDIGEIGFSSVLSAASSALVNGRSDSDGKFQLRGVGNGEFTIVANADNGDEGTLTIEVHGDMQDLIVPMQSRATATGSVVDADGKAVSGVRVEFNAHEKSKLRSFTANGLGNVTMTGALGRFAYEGLQGGDYDVSVHDKFQLAWAGSKRAPKDSPYRPVVVTIEPGIDPPPLHLVVESRSHTITGTVRDSSGLPLPDSWVTARWLDDEKTVVPSPRRRQNNRPVLSDQEGMFRLTELRAGHYQLWVNALHGNAKGGAKKVAVDSHVDIAVKALGEIAGSVSLAGAPVESFSLSATGPTKRRIQVTNSSGKFSLTKLEAGKYTLSCSSEVGVVSVTAVVKAGETTTRDLSLSTFGAVFGTLIDGESGEPIPDMAIIAAIGKDRNQWAASAMTLLDGSGPRTSENGEFRIERLNAGKGTLLIFDPKSKGFTPLVQKDFRLEVAQSLDLGTLESEIDLE